MNLFFTLWFFPSFTPILNLNPTNLAHYILILQIGVVLSPTYQDPINRLFESYRQTNIHTNADRSSWFGELASLVQLSTAKGYRWG